MITDAAWADIDGDKDIDLVIVGEYMPVKIFVNANGKFTDVTENAGMAKSNGWWNRIEPSDIDLDGDIDFVVGNHGLNSRFRGSETKPVRMYVNDFDQNGKIEHITEAYNGENSYPFVLRHELVNQIPSLKKKYLKYDNYKDQMVSDIFTAEQMASAIKLEAYELSSGLMINDGKGTFRFQALPVEAQVAPVYGIETGDFDEDGNPDILIGGNLYKTKPQVGRYDASYGLFLKGDGKGGFAAVAPGISGVNIDGEVRDIVTLSGLDYRIILVSRNSNSVVAYKIKNKK
jgi:hypothetical protein